MHDRPEFDLNKNRIDMKNKAYNLNSSDTFCVSNNGRIKAIHNNKEIASSQIRSQKIRPKSGKYNQNRPWSNKSYRRKGSDSSSRRGGSLTRKTIFATDARDRSEGGRCFNYHRTKVDDIISKANTYTKIETASTNDNKRMPTRYVKLTTQEEFDSNFEIYNGRTFSKDIKSSKASTRSYNSNDRPGSRRSSKSKKIRIMQSTNSKTINGVPVTLITSLFNAKCKDLQLRPKDGQLRRFYDFCSKAIQGRKYAFREIGLGYYSAKILGNILRLNK